MGALPTCLPIRKLPKGIGGSPAIVGAPVIGDDDDVKGVPCGGEEGRGCDYSALPDPVRVPFFRISERRDSMESLSLATS